MNAGWKGLRGTDASKAAGNDGNRFAPEMVSSQSCSIGRDLSHLQSQRFEIGSIPSAEAAPRTGSVQPVESQLSELSPTKVRALAKRQRQYKGRGRSRRGRLGSRSVRPGWTPRISPTLRIPKNQRNSESRVGISFGASLSSGDIHSLPRSCLGQAPHSSQIARTKDLGCRRFDGWDSSQLPCP